MAGILPKIPIGERGRLRFASSTIDTNAAPVFGGLYTSGLGVWIGVDKDTTGNVLVGDSVSQPIALAPGADMWFPASNPASIYIKSSAGTPLYYMIVVTL